MKAPLLSVAGLPAANEFPISQTEVYVFAAAIAVASFALFGLLAWQLSQTFRAVNSTLAMIAAGLLAVALGVFVEYHVVMVNKHAGVNSVETMALSAGIIIATAIVLAIILLPVPGYRPAFVRVGLALIVGAAVLAVSSFVAQEIIIRSEAESVPIAYLVMPSTGKPLPDIGPPLNPNGRTAIWYEPFIPKQYTVGESQVLTLQVHWQTSPIDAQTISPPYSDFENASGSTIPRCAVTLTARLAAPAFDQVAGDSDPIVVRPNENNVAMWSWIVTPNIAGLQLLYLHSDWKTAPGAKKCAKSYASPVGYDQFKNVQVKPAFFTVGGLPQWLALIASVVGIASAAFGMFRHS